MTQKASKLDGNVSTLLDSGQTVSADMALAAGAPSAAMYSYAHGITAWLQDNNGSDVDVVADYKASSSRPGGLMVRWGGPVTPETVAERFGPIPSWIQLRSDNNLDLAYVV